MRFSSDEGQAFRPFIANLRLNRTIRNIRLPGFPSDRTWENTLGLPLRRKAGTVMTETGRVKPGVVTPQRLPPQPG